LNLSAVEKHFVIDFIKIPAKKIALFHADIKLLLSFEITIIILLVRFNEMQMIYGNLMLFTRIPIYFLTKIILFFSLISRNFYA
jgi:hypothetical protein